MIKTYVAYLPSGLLEAFGTLDEADIPLNFTAFLTGISLEGVNIDTHYIPDTNNPVLTLKPSLGVTQSVSSILSDGVSSVVFDNIPVGASMEIYSPIAAQTTLPSIINDGTVSFSSTVFGEYTFVFFVPLHLEEAFLLEVLE